ncbi:MAG: zinc ribbon domain-containing protein [Crocinitomicaceae bacterium]|nr:zinc ribbon domain-containing protein [Crocinitomicaceae bacterium]MBK8926655.1 zinc ribbon domain-containing protein [Crocinitomicaceae bacterium]
MALIECNKCGNKISEFAAACPKCGEPKSTGSIPSIPAETLVSQLSSEETIKKPVEEIKKPIEQKQTAETNYIPPTQEKPEPKKSNTTKIVLFSLGGVAVIFLALFLSGVFDKTPETTDSSPSFNSSNSEGSSNNSEESDEDYTVTSSDDEEVDYEPEDEYYEDDEGESDISVKDVENNLDSYVRANVDYRQRLVTGVYEIQVAVTNNSPYTMETVRVEVQYQRLNNKVFDWEYLSYSNIAPYSTVTMDAPNKSEGSFVAVGVIEGKVSK